MAEAKLFDPADYLDSPEMIAAYLTEALESDDVAEIVMAVSTVVRACGMTAVAERAGVSSENLYRSLEGNAKPEFGTIIKVLHALRIDLVARPQADSKVA
jgi:probable addiction module antidote protein